MSAPSLSLVRGGTTAPDPAELDFAHAFTTLEEIAEEIGEGVSASLIYLEGDLALYLDEEDTDLALAQVADRDLHLMAGLVNLAAGRVERELERRAAVGAIADRALAGW